VEVLLDAGIDVFTTINIQHLESLNDKVFELTGVRVRETFPDRLLHDADEVVLVDLPPDALRERIAQGRVYAPDKVRPALLNFFRTDNLTALRALACGRSPSRRSATCSAPSWPGRPGARPSGSG
jgi:two-component system sensor histidine kinase KdpD